MDFKFGYDKEGDVLHIYRLVKVQGTIDIGNFYIDMDYEDKVCGIEVHDISDVLRKLGIDRPAEVLGNMTGASLEADYRHDIIIVYYHITSGKRVVSSSIAVQTAESIEA